jgi:hypothetical protein
MIAELSRRYSPCASIVARFSSSAAADARRDQQQPRATPSTLLAFGKSRLNYLGISFAYGLLLLVGAAVLEAQQAPIRVNAGGSSYTDSKGQLWSADSGFNNGSGSGCAPAATVSGTPDPLLFKSARYSATTSPELQYSFAAANGTYQVNLHFAETCPSLQIVGGRVFDVQMQSALVFSALDIFAAAGKIPRCSSPPT